MQTKVDLRELAIEREDAAVGPKRRPGQIVSRYVVPAVLVLALLGVMGWALRDVLVPPQPVSVIPVHVSRAEMQQAGTPLFKAAGWIEPRPTPILVAALAPGVVKELLVVEDQAVEEGEPVARLVDEDARLALQAAEADLKLRQAEAEQAQASLAAAKINYDKPLHLQAALAEAEAELAKVDAELAKLPFEKRSAEAKLRFAQQAYEGKSQAGDAISRRALDQSRSELDAATALVEQLDHQEASLQAHVQALTRRCDALREQLALKTEEARLRDEAAAEVKAAAARVEEAEAKAAQARLQSERMTVRAPVAGRILHLLASPGTRLMPGTARTGTYDASTVVTMYQPEQLQIRVDVRFEDLPQVRPGQPALVESPAVAEPMHGEVLFLTSQADIQKNTLEVKVAIESPPAVLKPEMLVDVTFLAPEQAQAEDAEEQVRLFVPKQLIERTEEGAYVWIADQEAGVARRVDVTTGRRGNSELIEVTEGLDVSSKLITDGREGLTDGQRIRITNEDPNLGT